MVLQTKKLAALLSDDVDGDVAFETLEVTDDALEFELDPHADAIRPNPANANIARLDLHAG